MSVEPRRERVEDAVTALLARPEILDEMVSLSQRGRPAVEAIGKQVEKTAPDLDDTGKQNVGRLVRAAMARRGWKPKRRARVAPGRFFAWGAVYAPVATGEPAADLDGPRRMAALREMLRERSIDIPSVDEFLAGRRAMWGE